MGSHKVIRVRSARANSTCPDCRAPILRGQRIASENGSPFVHIDCFIARRRAAAEPEPGREAS